MFGSYFFSILLHLALALLIFLWPSSPPVKLDQPMMQISVNMGAPGGNRMASPVLGPQGKPMPTKAAPQPAPAEQAASAVPVAREDTVLKTANTCGKLNAMDPKTGHLVMDRWDEIYSNVEVVEL